MAQPDGSCRDAAEERVDDERYQVIIIVCSLIVCSLLWRSGKKRKTTMMMAQPDDLGASGWAMSVEGEERADDGRKQVIHLRPLVVYSLLSSVSA
jgi:hypothetical protein